MLLSAPLAPCSRQIPASLRFPSLRRWGIRALNTFLPYSSFERSVHCLDKRRLGKQRVEAKQIYKIICDDPLPVLVRDPAVGLVESNPEIEHKDGEDFADSKWRKVKRRGWVNAPAVRMWRGYKDALAVYYNACLVEWERRGCRNILLQPMEVPADPVMPPWLGDEAVHASHRSNLLRKEREHYEQFGWTELDTLSYVWPVPVNGKQGL